MILKPYLAMFTAIIHLVSLFCVSQGRTKILSSTPERLDVELECRPDAEGFLPGKSCSPPLHAHGVRRLPQANKTPPAFPCREHCPSLPPFPMTGRPASGTAWATGLPAQRTRTAVLFPPGCHGIPNSQVRSDALHAERDGGQSLPRQRQRAHRPWAGAHLLERGALPSHFVSLDSLRRHHRRPLCEPCTRLEQAALLGQNHAPDALVPAPVPAAPVTQTH